MKKLFFLIVLIMVSCSSNEEVLRDQNSKIEVETICDSGNVRTYEISSETRANVQEFLDKHGSFCVFVTFETTDKETKKGYFVKFL